MTCLQVLTEARKPPLHLLPSLKILLLFFFFSSRKPWPMLPPVASGCRPLRARG